METEYQKGLVLVHGIKDSFFSLIVNALSGKYDFLFAKTLKETEEIFHQEIDRICLLLLPQKEAAQTCKKILIDTKTERYQRGISSLIILDTLKNEQISSYFELGLDDIVLRHLNIDLAIRRIESILQKRELVKQREKELLGKQEKDHESRYRFILDQARVHIIEYRYETKEFFVDQKTKELLAIPEYKTVLPTIFDQIKIFHPDDQKAVLSLFPPKWDRGSPFSKSIICRVLHRDGTYHYYDITWSNYAVNGVPLKLFITLINVDSQKIIEEKMAYLALYDEMTGLYNKNSFLSAINQYSLQNKEKSYIISLDIQRFRSANSLLGGKECDRVICEIGHLLKKTSANYNAPYTSRVYGDEFAVFLVGEKERVIEFIKEFQETAKGIVPKYDLYFFFGVAELTLETTATDCLSESAAAKKTIKRQYGDENNICFYSQETRKEETALDEIVSEMERALKERQFQVYFQPKVDTFTGHICSAEALVRWMHPTKGMISPGKFIPIFEKNGFIIELDWYVWEEVCKALSKWNKEGTHSLPISVNVTRLHLHNPNFIPDLLSLLKKYDVSPAFFELEFTESAIAIEGQNYNATLDSLHEHGFKIHMDDFGSGYSSLACLRALPIDVLKLDIGFLKESAGKDKIGKIFVSIVRMAKWIGMPVIVEGVETSEQLSFVKNSKCEYIQGYYFYKPMPLENFEQALSKENKMVRHRNDEEDFVGIDINALWDPKSTLNEFFNHILGPSAIYEFDGNTIQVIKENDAYKTVITKDSIRIPEGDDPGSFYVSEQGKELVNYLRRVVGDFALHIERLNLYMKDGTIRKVSVRSRKVSTTKGRHLIFVQVVDVSDIYNQELMISRDLAGLKKMFFLFEQFAFTYSVKEGKTTVFYYGGGQTMELMEITNFLERVYESPLEEESNSLLISKLKECSSDPKPMGFHIARKNGLRLYARLTPIFHDGILTQIACLTDLAM